MQSVRLNLVVIDEGDDDDQRIWRFAFVMKFRDLIVELNGAVFVPKCVICNWNVCAFANLALL